MFNETNKPNPSQKKNLKNPLKKPKKNLQKIRVSPAGDFIFFSSSFIK